MAPDAPTFTWTQLLDNDMPVIKVTWLPNVDGNPGSHFYVQYRRKGETIFEKSAEEFDEEFLVLRGFDTGQIYEMRVVSVDGDLSTASQIEEMFVYPGDHFHRYFSVRFSPTANFFSS